ncbi:1-deoxy-D-xylulose-5-phosphate reductoisomerase [Actinomycetaceae bacterium TAE3-ERU4]|nr:1-deoxy-D-xylulose-5-phosphate reductoisomerase [Actinomycetaceae bacterium TAE3-ERU4]
MRKVSLLGSTGSIGRQCLEVIADNRDDYRVLALSAGGSQLELLASQAVDFEVPLLAIATEEADSLRSLIADLELRRGLTSIEREIVCGPHANEVAASCVGQSGVVVNGINGAIGLTATLAALAAGSTLALANKESLVVGGSLVAAAMVRPGQIVPVDSEHSAIAQCLRSGVHERGMTVPVITGRSEVSKLILTASGGPFRGWTRAQLEKVTLEQALNHPTWSMGPVVTINSATLMNKALELVEAHLLFDIPADDIIPVIHPQSHIHSAVRWQDGSTIMQSSPPSMLIPIALGMSWPERLCEVAAANEFDSPFGWSFEPVDNKVFIALDLARAAANAGGGTPAVMNAANEVAVDAFRKGNIGFLQIVDTVSAVCERYVPSVITDLKQLEEVDVWARKLACEFVANTGAGR